MGLDTLLIPSRVSQRTQNMFSTLAANVQKIQVKSQIVVLDWQEFKMKYNLQVEIFKKH